MSRHVNHMGLPGRDPFQIWVDGCPVCESRSRDLPMTIMKLDPNHFRAAWMRAFWWQHDGDTSLNLSRAEIPLLQQIWAMQVALERFCGWPVGTFPENPERGREPGGPEDMTGVGELLGTHPNMAGAKCRFGYCQHEAEEMGAVPAQWFRLLRGSGDASSVPLCHSHAEMIRQADRNGCDLPRCRFPFGGHAQTCARYIPFRSETSI